MPITRATNLAGLGTIFDSLTDGGGLSVSGISTFTDLNITRVNITGVGTISNGSITNLTGTSSTITTGNFTTGNFTTGNIVTGVTTNFTSTNVVITGVTTVSAGTALLPSISPSGDPNTGIFFPSADTIAFGEGGVEAVRIDSSGRLLVGTSTDSGTSALVEVAVGGQNAAQFGRYTSSSIPVVIILSKSRSDTKGSHTIVQNNDGMGRLAFYGSDGTKFLGGAEIEGAVDSTPGNNDMPGRLVFSTTADGADSSTEAMRINNQREVLIGTTTRNANGGILQLKSGITFPATAVAATDVNTLDDYEEGTWTAAFSTGGGSITIHPSFNTGGYTKVGRLVTVNLHARCSSVSSPTGALSITGLPFAPNSSNQCRNAGACAAIAVTTLATPMTAYVNNNEAIITLTGFVAASGGYANASTYINASSEIYITLTYYV